jgi:hypothetical protein
VLADAVAQRQGIAVVEMVERTPLAMLGVFAGLLVLLVATPFIRPFSVRRLLFTYPIPLIPLALVWDGLVSCLRVYSPRELCDLIARVPAADRFAWDTGRVRVAGTPTHVTYLIGTPKPCKPLDRDGAQPRTNKNQEDVGNPRQAASRLPIFRRIAPAYSSRRASVGWIRSARRAGPRVASKPEKSMMAATNASNGTTSPLNMSPPVRRSRRAAPAAPTRSPIPSCRVNRRKMDAST